MVFQQISEMTTGTKFAPPYAYINMDRVEQDFSETHELQPFLHVFLSYGPHEKGEFMEHYMEKFIIVTLLPTLSLCTSPMRKISHLLTSWLLDEESRKLLYI